MTHLFTLYTNFSKYVCFNFRSFAQRWSLLRLENSDSKILFVLFRDSSSIAQLSRSLFPFSRFWSKYGIRGFALSSVVFFFVSIGFFCFIRKYTSIENILLVDNDNWIYSIVLYFLFLFFVQSARGGKLYTKSFVEWVINFVTSINRMYTNLIENCLV